LKGVSQSEIQFSKIESHNVYKSTKHEQEGLETVPYDGHPEVVPHAPTSDGYTQYTTVKPLLGRGRRGTLFGLRKPTFFLAVLLALAVVAIAVVGGVLGTRKTR
jgi:hypothetical protein